MAAWLLAGIVGAGAGCAPANREDLVKQVLAKDPEFSSVLAKHKELGGRINTYERELALKRTTIEGQIAQLRKDLAAAAKSARERTAQVKTQLDPDRERLKLALSMAAEQLRSAQAQRASIGRSISQLRKSLKDESLGQADRTSQQARVEDLARDTQRLDQELTTLREHIRLLKIKLLLIRL